MAMKVEPSMAMKSTGRSDVQTGAAHPRPMGPSGGAQLAGQRGEKAIGEKEKEICSCKKMNQVNRYHPDTVVGVFFCRLWWF